MNSNWVSVNRGVITRRIYGLKFIFFLLLANEKTVSMPIFVCSMEHWLFTNLIRNMHDSLKRKPYLVFVETIRASFMLRVLRVSLLHIFRMAYLQFFTAHSFPFGLYILVSIYRTISNKVFQFVCVCAYV